MLPFASAKMQGLETPRESENVAQTASAERRAAKIETIQGFNSRRWSERGLNYWAVSDLAADGLAEFDDKFEASMRTSTAG
jgi:anti-sigma factor RsiW